MFRAQQGIENDIDELWLFFELALDYSSSPTPAIREKLAKAFDLAINKKGNGNSKITMALYWIAPNSFLNLDQLNTWYIYESGELPLELVNSLPKIEQKIAADNYFKIVEKLREFLNSESSEFKDFKDLSAEAWRYSQEVNEENKNISSEKTVASKAAFLRWMGPLLQALKDLGGSAKAQEASDKFGKFVSFMDNNIRRKDIISNINKYIQVHHTATEAEIEQAFEDSDVLYKLIDAKYDMNYAIQWHIRDISRYYIHILTAELPNSSTSNEDAYNQHITFNRYVREFVDNYNYILKLIEQPELILPT